MMHVLFRGRGGAGAALFLLLVSSAMYISSSALLPSSFCMYLVTLATSQLIVMGVPDAGDYDRMRTTVRYASTVPPLPHLHFISVLFQCRLCVHV